MITLADGTKIDTTDFRRLMEIVADHSRTKKAKVTEIKSKDGVTVRLGNLTPTGKQPDYANYTESFYKGRNIRVWKYDRDSLWGCNVIWGEGGKNICYLEFYSGDYPEENDVFRQVNRYIDDARI